MPCHDYHQFPTSLLPTLQVFLLPHAASGAPDTIGDLQGLLSKDNLQATYQGDQWVGKMSHAGLVGKPLYN